MGDTGHDTERQWLVLREREAGGMTLRAGDRITTTDTELLTWLADTSNATELDVEHVGLPSQRPLAPPASD